MGAVKREPALEVVHTDEPRDAGARDGIETSAGARARVSGDVLEVHDERGMLIFEHRPGKSIVYAPGGDLELRADAGSIDLVAANAVRVKATRAVELSSEEGVHLSAQDRAGRSLSRLSLLRRAVVLATPLLSARSARAEVELDEGSLVARATATEVGHVKQVVEILETRAGQILERARESYREVEGLSQTKAGRLRLVAEKTLHVLGRRALFKAYEDMKLRGEKIYIS